MNIVDYSKNMEDYVGIRALYPNLSDKTLREAEENLEQYLLLVLRIYERLLADPIEYQRFRTLTENVGTLPCTPPSSTLPKKSDLNRP